MSERDQTAERQVAGSQSQNPPREKLKIDHPTGFCEQCDREITRRDPVWIIGMWLACSQECADALAERDRAECFELDAEQAAAHPMRQVIAEFGNLKVGDVIMLHDDEGNHFVADVVREPMRPKTRTRIPAEPFADIAPHQASSPTSVASAEKNATTMRSKMFLIYEHIRQQGLHGATRQELADDLGISLQTVCGRVRRLYQMGRIGSNPGHVRANRLSGFDNEVMLHETFVDRWTDDQSRPPERVQWERAR